MQDAEQEPSRGSTVVAFSDSQRPSTSSKHKPSTPQIEILKQRRDQLRRNHPEVAEAERLRKKIETLEREATRHERVLLESEDGGKLKKIKSRDGVKFFARVDGTIIFRWQRCIFFFKCIGFDEP